MCLVHYMVTCSRALADCNTACLLEAMCMCFGCALAHSVCAGRPWAPLQDVHAPKEQGRYYIIMPAGGVSGGRQEGPRVLEEVYITE